MTIDHSHTKNSVALMRQLSVVFLLSRLKEGQQISQSDRIKIVKEKETHSLTIEKARLEDTGSYSVSENLFDCEGGCLHGCDIV